LTIYGSGKGGGKDLFIYSKTQERLRGHRAAQTGGVSRKRSTSRKGGKKVTTDPDDSQKARTTEYSPTDR